MFGYDCRNKLFPPIYSTLDVMVDGRIRGDYQNCSVLYCVLQLCTNSHVSIFWLRTVLTVGTVLAWWHCWQETNCNCCIAAYVYLLLFTLPIICIALFYRQLFYLFGQSFSKPPIPTHNRLFSESPTFGGTQHYLQSDVKVLHFTR